MTYPIFSFNYTNTLPFPTATNFVNTSLYTDFSLPYIAFNYLGQLTVDGTDMSRLDEYIPLAQGGIIYAVDGNKALQLPRRISRKTRRATAPTPCSMSSMWTG